GGAGRGRPQAGPLVDRPPGRLRAVPLLRAVNQYAPRMRWRQALRVFTLLLIAGLIVVIVLIHDKDVVALTVITFVLLLFLPSKRAWVGVIGLTLLFADVLFFTGAAALSNIRHHETLTTV